MYKKNEVYVVVDTPKKAKKLKKVLDMFGEEESYPGVSINSELKAKELIHFWFGKFVWSDLSNIEEDNKTEVSIKELKNILAVEHLKEGDVVMMRSKELGKIILEVRGLDEKTIDIKNELYVDEGSRFSSGTEIIGEIQFIRYATEEEKQLLNPKKELEVGKWYKGVWKGGWFLAVFNGIGEESYGIHCYNNEWFDQQYWFNKKTISELNFTEAPNEEVEKALIEEAKSRYNVGDVIKCLDGVESEVNGTDFVFNNNGLYSNGERIDGQEWFNTSGKVFDNGQWATIIEQDKFAELKEAHRNGAFIQANDGQGWYDDDYPNWLSKEYRIKPQPKFTDKDVAIIERLNDTLVDNHKYHLQSSILIDARVLADKIKSNIK